MASSFVLILQVPRPHSSLMQELGLTEQRLRLATKCACCLQYTGIPTGPPTGCNKSVCEACGHAKLNTGREKTTAHEHESSVEDAPLMPDMGHRCLCHQPMATHFTRVSVLLVKGPAAHLCAISRCTSGTLISTSETNAELLSKRGIHCRSHSKNSH
jgi:hypothetical protein